MRSWHAPSQVGRADLGDTRVSQHVGEAAHEAVLARGVPAPEAGARLLEVVLLHNDGLLPAAAQRRAWNRVALTVAHWIKAGWEVVHLQPSSGSMIKQPHLRYTAQKSVDHGPQRTTFQPDTVTSVSLPAGSATMVIYHQSV